jgi:hypothetical protein
MYGMLLNVILRNGIQIRVLVCDVRKLPAADWPDPSWQSIDGCRSASSPHPSFAVLLCLLSHLDARRSLSVFLSLTMGSLYAASILALKTKKMSAVLFSEGKLAPVSPMYHAEAGV